MLLQRHRQAALQLGADAELVKYFTVICLWVLVAVPELLAPYLDWKCSTCCCCCCLTEPNTHISRCSLWPLTSTVCNSDPTKTFSPDFCLSADCSPSCYISYGIYAWSKPKADSAQSAPRLRTFITAGSWKALLQAKQSTADTAPVGSLALPPLTGFS